MNQFTSERVYNVVSQIPRGRVLTYGLVAKLAGIKSPRLVGKILHNNPDPEHIPCHRVVNGKGQIAKTFAFGGAREQYKLLVQEGIVFENNRIDLKKYSSGLDKVGIS